MKVLHLIQKSQLRGAEVFASQLATHLNSRGHQAILVCLFSGNGDLPFNGKKINLNGKFKSRLYDVKAWRTLAKIIKAEQPDIVQANAGDTLKYAVFSKLFFQWKQPIVFRNASTISLYIKTKLAKIWNSFFFHHVAKIVSVSKVSQQDFAMLFPQCKEKIITIPIGIDDNHINLFKKKTNEENGHSLYYGRPALIHVGGFTFEKNHVGLINIFEYVSKKIPTCSLQLIGDGILRKDIEEIVRKKNLSNKVCFHGQKQALQFIRNADVLLLPSFIEGLPAVILEAFFCKTPVVAYDVGGIKEIVINNETGRLIEKGNEKAFANEVLAALENNVHNKKMIENAYRLVMTRYSNTHIANKFLEVYQSILS